MTLRQTKKLVNIHEEALVEFNRVWSAQQELRRECMEDRRFCFRAGAQWEGWLADQFENKPKLEINKVHLSVIRIQNEYRNNRITVNYIPKNGEKNQKLSDLYNGLYRAVSEVNVAQEAKDNAFEEAVSGGIGALRLRAEYEDEYDLENEHQHIVIEPIYDADQSVYFDLDAKRFDKSDARFCFVVYSQTKEAFMDEWDEDPSTWPRGNTDYSFYDWDQPNIVYVAELYRIEEVSESVYVYKTLDGEEEKYKDEDFDNDEKLGITLEAVGTVFERERKIKKRRVHKYIFSGNSILEDCGYIAGEHIPIAPAYGKRGFINNIEWAMGQVRLAKDVQRIKNMQTSRLAEISALSPVEKPILTPEQIAGHEKSWTDSNIVNPAFLLLNPVIDKDGNKAPLPPLDHTKVPNIPPAMAALLQITDVDMKEILGNQESSEQMIPNIASKTVGMFQEKLDMMNNIYLSNWAKTEQRMGEIFLSMSKELYVESGRKMKTVGTQGEIDSVELMTPGMDKDTGEVTMENDLSKANFHVQVDVGPSTSSRRSAVVQAINEMLGLTQDPETIKVLTAMAFMNMEGEGIQDVRDYFRKVLLRMGVLKPTTEEAEEMARELENQKPDPQAEYLEAAGRQADAEASNKRAETMLTIAKTTKTQAESGKVEAEMYGELAEIDHNEQRLALDAKEKLIQSNGDGKVQPAR